MSDSVAEQTADLLALADVKRWTVIKTLRNQSVAEHTFAVIVIATELACRLGHNMWLWEITRWALIHDLPETLTGDIDGKFKRDFPDVRAAITAGENAAFPWYKAEASQLTSNPVVKWVVKLADTIEAIHFIETWGRGARADNVKHELTAIMHNQVASAAEAIHMDSVEVVTIACDILHRSIAEDNSIQLRKIGRE